MDKQSLLEQVYENSFNDELEKIATDSDVKKFNIGRLAAAGSGLTAGVASGLIAKKLKMRNPAAVGLLAGSVASFPGITYAGAAKHRMRRNKTGIYS